MKPVALVTGAAGGIGQALCAAFAGAGYRVVGTDVRGSQGSCDRFVSLDLRQLVRDARYRAEAFAALDAAIGNAGLRVLVNNAAVQHLNPFDQLRPDDVRDTLDVNVSAPLLLAQGVLSALERAAGSIVNISSVHAGATKPGFVAYATSKAALAGLTRALAVDLGGRVRVNAIQPAATATPMLTAGLAGREGAIDEFHRAYPMGRIAEPREVAAAAVFLASEAASFITGATLNVDGGISARLGDPV